MTQTLDSINLRNFSWLELEVIRSSCHQGVMSCHICIS
jgi:hypothetical protein